MASRTQLRLQQVTGSAVDLKTEAQQYIAANTVQNLTGSDIQDLLGMVGGALLRIHGAASDEPFNSAEGTFATSVFDVNSTGNITIDSNGGTIGIGVDDDDQNINIGTDGQREVTIGDASAANSAGVTIRANTGGIDIDCSQSTGALSLDTAGGAIEIGVNAAAGAINIGTNATQRKITIGSATGNTEVEIATGTGGVDVDSTGKINIATSNANADAIVIDASGNAGIDITAGNAANDANANLDIIAMNKVTIDAQGTDADDGVEITLGADTSSVKFVVQNNSGNDALVVDGLLDVQVGRNLTVTGDLTVNGDTVTLDVTNKSIQDQLIILNSGSAANPTKQDVGIIFAQPDISRVLYVDDSDSSKFVFATTYTSGTATGANAVTKLADADVRMGGLTTSGVTNSSLTDNRVVIAGASGVLEDDANFTFNGTQLTVGSNFNVQQGTGVARASKLEIDSADDFVDVSGGFLLVSGSSGVKLAADDGSTVAIEIEGELQLTLEAGQGAAVLSSSAGNDLQLDSNSSMYLFTVGGAEKGMLLTDPDLTLSSSEGANIALDTNSGKIMLQKDGSNGTDGKNFGLFLTGSGPDESLRFAMSQQTYAASTGDVGNYFAEFNASDTYASNYLGLSGSLRLLEDGKTNKYIEFKAPAMGGGSSTTYTFPAQPTNNFFLKTNASGVLSWADAATAVSNNIAKAVFTVKPGVTISAGTDGLQLTGSFTNGNDSEHFALVDANHEGDLRSDISTLTDSEMFKKLEVYVNGQLLTSGSSNASGVTSGDYAIVSRAANSLSGSFAFDLEQDDVITLIRRN